MKSTKDTQNKPSRGKQTLVRSGETGKVELSEDELRDVSGGCCTGEHLTIGSATAGAGAG